MMRIMIIESDWRFEIKARRYFESRADLVVHETPANAVEHARRWQPDLVILAAEFARKDLLDSLRRMPDSPAVLITEHMSRFDRAWRAWQIGGDELLMKPIFHHFELQQASRAAMEHATLKTGSLPRWTAASA